MIRLLIILLLLHPSPCANKSWFSFIVFWNVGQGQWITAVTPDQCRHYDFGGELVFWNKNKNLFLKLCKEKENVLYLSHADLDHYALYSVLTQSVARICWSEIDHTNIPLKRVSRKIPVCMNEVFKDSQRLFTPQKFSNKNDSSKIYQHKNVLIPGDSSQKQEKSWVKVIEAKEFKYLVLGHHGSRTSTSDLLLSKLKYLKMAIAQSRKSKFDHPHKETIDRLKKYYVPFIRTEDWGNTAIVFE